MRKKMRHLILAALALASAGTLSMGCQGCHSGATSANDLRKSKDVPAVIADARLLSYQYTLHGTMRYPLRSENVELCKEDSTRCIIRLFDESRATRENFDQNGDLVPDSLVVGSEVLDSIKQMIVNARAWRFKKDYCPRVKTLDGYSWAYSASFAVTDSMLAATPEADRPRLLRRGGQHLYSGGNNASPDTELFEQIHLYLQEIYESEKSR